MKQAPADRGTHSEVMHNRMRPSGYRGFLGNAQASRGDHLCARASSSQLSHWIPYLNLPLM